MATDETKRSRAARDDQAKVEQAAHQAGIADALSEAVGLAPQVLALQKAVLEGLARSQNREAERLKARHGENDPRIARASNRALRFDELRMQTVAQAEVADRLAQTFRIEGIFHGYVHHADATPAAGHTVRLALRGASDTKQQAARTTTAKTDATGYFRMDIGKGSREKGAAAGLDPWVERVTTALSRELDEAAAPEEAGERVAGTHASATTDGGNAATAAQVEVIDPSGRVVFEDPVPPSFDELASEFRYYTLAQAQAPRPTTKPTRKR
ncbi:MAG TPA: hypothetical protein VGE16_16045 [Albitalea sp.]